MSLPWIYLEQERQFETDSLPVGLQPFGRQEDDFARGAGRPLGRVHIHTGELAGPQSGGVSRTPARTLQALASRGMFYGDLGGQSGYGELEGDHGSLHGGVAHPRDASATIAVYRR